MKSRTILMYVVLPLLSLGILSCDLPPVMATLQATIVDESDTTGAGSALATINFTEFSSSNSDSGTQLQFKNPEGDVITLTVSVASSGIYVIGISSELTGQVGITRDLQTTSQSIIANSGTLSLNVFEKDAAGNVSKAQGIVEDIVLQGGGTASFTFNGSP